ncbi:MAG: YebC/PmpR family DNA-binding transcriptional regulator [Firmicutes bacterium]|nr:YebC/PmpR family DNA-binding transcriptional regulator [Bacillota bacterium]
MAGHSKWAQIKRAKGANDVARGKMFTKIGKEIHVAVKLGGPDPDGNPRLALVIKKAKENNMPNDNINRAIKNASGAGKDTNYESITYEGYAPGGVAVMVQCLTDNKNRTASDIRHAFEKYGGSLGVTGAVSFIFVEIDGEYLPDYTNPLDDEKSKLFEKFLDKLDDCDDVQDVWHNAE